MTARWNYTLNNMVEEGWLPAAKRATMKFPSQDPKGVPGMEGQTGYLVDAANSALANRLVAKGAAANYEDAKALVDAGGWMITLNIDKKKQTQLEVAVKTKLTGKLDAKKRRVDGDVEVGAASA